MSSASAERLGATELPEESLLFRSEEDPPGSPEVRAVSNSHRAGCTYVYTSIYVGIYKIVVMRIIMGLMVFGFIEVLHAGKQLLQLL